jgi:hypothetical protein
MRSGARYMLLRRGGAESASAALSEPKRCYCPTPGPGSYYIILASLASSQSGYSFVMISLRTLLKKLLLSFVRSDPYYQR